MDDRQLLSLSLWLSYRKGASTSCLVAIVVKIHAALVEGAVQWCFVRLLRLIQHFGTFHLPPRTISIFLFSNLPSLNKLRTIHPLNRDGGQQESQIRSQLQRPPASSARSSASCLLRYSCAWRAGFQKFVTSDAKSRVSSTGSECELYASARQRNCCWPYYTSQVT